MLHFQNLPFQLKLRIQICLRVSSCNSNSEHSEVVGLVGLLFSWELPIKNTTRNIQKPLSPLDPTPPGCPWRIAPCHPTPSGDPWRLFHGLAHLPRDGPKVQWGLRHPPLFGITCPMNIGA